MPALPLESDDPREVGHYRLTARLGEGGQGVVYLGTAPDGRQVAVKMLKTTAAEARARFVREMEAARRVAPFCTAAVLDSSVEGRHPYVVSEYVDGPSLQERVARHGPLRGGDLDRLVVNTASGLAAIHGAGVVHRDLKPANVLLGPDGPRVVDFGIARAIDAETHTQMVGTPAYFAPEWLRGERPTPASDIFAWAGTMVFAATGRPPFGRTDVLPALLHRISTADPDLTGVPDGLRGLLAECLDKDPARRPSARDLLVRLVDPTAGSATSPTSGPASGPAHHPQGAPPPTVTPQGTATHPAEPARRGRTGRWVAVAVAGAVLLAAIVGTTAWIVASTGDRADPGADGRSSPPVAQARPTQSSPGDGGSPDGGGTPPGGQGTAVPAGFAGTWTGRLEQPAGLFGGATSTGVTVTFPPGAATGTAVYNDWGCRASLTPTATEGDTLTLTEAITGGPAGCQGGSLTLALVGDELRYTSTGLTGTVSATLRKKNGGG
ncbi:serine/threonine-protein kinase [Actinomadura craniellae]|uniref:serine/threonine-protein kinase n=1 Tax=Actinomadura craniellae TaxID=2231787 RepID=UPI001F41FFE8|nr:serine/threonine-protein kinase [Actinomadura craniellae]